MDNSPFNNLSAEIRNHIYSLALTSKEPIPGFNSDGSVVKPAALTHTCKQIRSESLLLFYAVSSFTAPPPIMADRTTSRDLLPEGGELPDRPFIDSIDKVTNWLKNLSIEFHYQNASLQLRLGTEDHWMFPFTLMDQRKKLFRGLRGELRRQGFEDDRVTVVYRDKLCVFGLGDGLGHWQYYTSYDSIVSSFKDVGFNVDIDGTMDIWMI